MKTDVLIIGGGPGGSAMAMFLVRQGIKPVILEQEEFPRYHIGESLTGEAGQVLRRLGFEDEMVKREHPVSTVSKFSARVARIPGTFPFQPAIRNGTSHFQPHGRCGGAISIR